MSGSAVGLAGQRPATDAPTEEKLPHFAATTLHISETVNSDAVRGYLRELPQSLQRVKGYLQTPEGIVEVQQVGGQIEIHPRPQLTLGSTELGLVLSVIAARICPSKRRCFSPSSVGIWGHKRVRIER